MPEDRDSQATDATTQNDAQSSQGVSREEFERLQEKFDREALRTHDLKKRLEGYKGLTPEDVEALRADHQELQSKNVGADNAEVQSLVEQRVSQKLKEFESEWEKDKQRAEDAQKQLKELTITDAAMKEINAEFSFSQDPFIQDSLRSMVRSSVDRDEDGNLYVKDQDGNPIRARGTATGHMSVKEWASQIAETNPTLISQSVKKGTTSSGSQKSYKGTGGELTYKDYMGMSRDERQALPADLRQKLASQIPAGAFGREAKE